MQNDTALFYFNKVIKLNEFHEGAHNNKGNIFRKLGQLKESIISFNNAIKINSSYSEAYYNIGLSYLDLKYYQDAKDNFLKAIKFNANNSDAHYNLGITLTEMKCFSDSIGSYSNASDLLSDQEDYHFGRGLAYNQLGLYRLQHSISIKSRFKIFTRKFIIRKIKNMWLDLFPFTFNRNNWETQSWHSSVKAFSNNFFYRLCCAPTQTGCQPFKIWKPSK